jgi:SAM-dependent methyltransferase
MMQEQDTIQREKAKYERLYREVPEYNTFSPGENLAILLLNTMKHNNIKSVLDAGCGKGQLVNIFSREGYDVRGADITLDGLYNHVDRSLCDETPLSNLPYESDKFDLVTCIDVLEHIPADNGVLEKSIAEMSRVCCNFAIFQIALCHDSYGKRIGEVLHQSVMPKEAWLKILSKHFFAVVLADQIGSNIVVFCQKRVQRCH